MTRTQSIVGVVVGSVCAGLLLALADGSGFTPYAWLAYSVYLAVGLAAILLVFTTLQGQGAPTLILWLAVGTLALRLVVGLALARALPDYGYDENAQNRGYVFWDAYKRDTDSWERARGDLPLLASFTDPRGSDQYGGLLLVSVGTYRALGDDVHRPLQIVVLTAAASALGLLFTWGFANAVWGRHVGKFAAWIVLLTPEAILLGASQMREAFLILGMAMALYGYSRSRRDRRTRGVAWLGGGLLVLLFFSPPTALVGAVVVWTAALWEGKDGPRIPRWVLWLGVPVAIAGLVLAVQSWARLEQITGTFGQIIVQWWENAGAAWRFGQVAAGSDMLQATLDKLPDALRLPFLVGYGLVQPFLPAAIASSGNGLWQGIAILRALGWFAFIPLLIYGTVAAISKQGWRSLEAYLGILVWVSALLASYRAPGYQWDNPRYRAVFLAAQASLAAWAWVVSRSEPTPWLKRIYACLGLATLLVLQWYLGRRVGLPSLNLEGTLVATMGAVAAYLLVGVYRDWRTRSTARPKEPPTDV